VTSRRLTPGCAAGSAVGGFITRHVEVDGQPGALFSDRDGSLIGVAVLDVAEGQIQGVGAIVNPDKLRHLESIGDVDTLLRERR